MNRPARLVALALLLTAIACSSDTAPASTPSPSTGGGGTPPAPSPPPTGGGATTPAFAGEANSATDGSGAAFNRSSLSLNVSGTGTLLIVAWHAEFDGGAPDGWTVTANGILGR